jgi:hypothetical protein
MEKVYEVNSISWAKFVVYYFFSTSSTDVMAHILYRLYGENYFLPMVVALWCH